MDQPEMGGGGSPARGKWGALGCRRALAAADRLVGGFPDPLIHFTRRPLKNPAFVVFCLMFAVSPCSAEFCISSWPFEVSLLILASSPVPLLLRFPGGTGGISL